MTVVKAGNEPVYSVQTCDGCCCCICLLASRARLLAPRGGVVCNLSFRLAIAITDVISQGVSVRMRCTQRRRPLFLPVRLLLPR